MTTGREDCRGALTCKTRHVNANDRRCTTQIGVERKTQDSKDKIVSPWYCTTLLWQGGHKGAYIECGYGCVGEGR
jgi:hypothetical protein